MARRLYDGNPPGASAPYTERYANRRRLAVCFHCRSVMRLDQDADDGTFLEHFDVDRTNPKPGRFGHRATIKIQGVDQICPGSGTMPIPLAYKFPDGEPLPYYSRY